MTQGTRKSLLDQINNPGDIKRLSPSKLPQLCDDLREEMIDTVLQTGGHLGASLGVVELSVALHRVFETPRDKLIWDVGHQSYPHKMLTGRRDAMKSLRQQGGLSGFTKRAEGPHDPFGAGHSSTSISAALGFAAARDLGRRDIGEVVAIIGDGALSAGMAFEALNNAGALRTRLLIILNDNEMSISPPTGALSTHLMALGEGRAAPEIFGALAITYLGPVDGHDVAALCEALGKAKEMPGEGPILLHVRTSKGKGYAPAEQAEDKGHGIAKIQSHPNMPPAGNNIPTYTEVFSQTLIALAEDDERICGVTAAMSDGTGLRDFSNRFAGRFFDVGIAEQHAVTFSAGLAAANMRPFCAIYSTFLQRAYDQVVHDVALQGLPVRFCIDRAGLVGADGATHAGAYDISFLSNLPNFTVMAPSDEHELQRMLVTAAQHDRGPISVRYPRGSGVGVSLDAEPRPLEIGRGRLVRQGSDIAVISLGTRLGDVLGACEALRGEGIEPSVVDARFVRPLDRDLILQMAHEHRVILTIEEGAIGGFASHVGALLAGERGLKRGLIFQQMTLPLAPIEQNTPGQMLREAGLCLQSIQERLRAISRDL